MNRLENPWRQALGLIGFCASLNVEAALILYENTFDSNSSLDDFTELHTGSAFGRRNFSVPHPQVAVEGGQLVVRGNSISDRFFLGPDSRTFGPAFASTLDSNAAPISWSFNVSYQDGRFNRPFR